MPPPPDFIAPVNQTTRKWMPPPPDFKAPVNQTTKKLMPPPPDFKAPVNQTKHQTKKNSKKQARRLAVLQAKNEANRLKRLQNISSKNHRPKALSRTQPVLPPAGQWTPKGNLERVRPPLYLV
jgi:hypothetical protein